MAKRNATAVAQKPPEVMRPIVAPVANRSRLPLWSTINGPGFDSLFYAGETRATLEGVVARFAARDRLRAAGVSVRSRVALLGAPGWGKTSAATAIAAALNVPCLRVDVGQVFSSYLGETAQHIDDIVAGVTLAAPCVLLWDEFDGVAQNRGDTKDIGEMRRVAAAFMVALERVEPLDVVTIAASNYPQLVDPAVWRRFDVVAQIGPKADGGTFTDDETRRLQHGLLQSRFPVELVVDSILRVDWAAMNWADAYDVPRDASLADLARICDTATARALLAGRKPFDVEDWNAGYLDYDRRRRALAAWGCL